MSRKGLGVRPSPDVEHIEKYPLAPVLGAAPERVEAEVALPDRYRAFYDQGAKNACVGFSVSQMATIHNRTQFDPWWLWDRAKERDPWPDTNPGDNNGTDINAALAVLKKRGHREDGALRARKKWRILRYRWLVDTSEVRHALGKGRPVVVATSWYSSMAEPEFRNGEFWMPKEPAGSFHGYHAYLIEAWSDARNAARTPNSWGHEYPRTWIPAELLDGLLSGRLGWANAAVAWDR